MTAFRRIFPALFSLLLIAATSWSTSTMAQGAETKIATVDIQKLFKQYHLTAKMQEQINVEQARIKKDNEERLARIRTLEEQLETLGKQLEDSTIADSKKQELFKERQNKLQEGSALDQERRKWLARREQALREKLMQRMKGILEEIRKLVEEQAVKSGYDFVFDKSGQSTSQVSFLLYAKDATDITADLLKVLNKDAE